MIDAVDDEHGHRRTRRLSRTLRGGSKRRQQLLELRLVHAHRLERAGALDEDVPAGRSDDRAEQAVASDLAGAVGERTTEAGVIAGYVDCRHRETVDGALGNLRRRGPAAGDGELAPPPSDVVLDA